MFDDILQRKKLLQTINNELKNLKIGIFSKGLVHGLVTVV